MLWTAHSDCWSSGSDDVWDSFRTENEFHGGELGLMGELQQGCWTLKGMAKVSIGNLRQEITLNGQTTTNGVTTPGRGLFVQDSNRGEYINNDTKFIPEATVSLGYQVLDHVSISIGYHAMWIDSVALAGDQIDRTVSLLQLTPRPQFQLRETEFWVQGITFGLNWDF